jgi:hypothetical protein
LGRQDVRRRELIKEKESEERDREREGGGGEIERDQSQDIRSLRSFINGIFPELVWLGDQRGANPDAKDSILV